MYPPIWSLARKAEAADIIGGHEIEPGDTIVMCTYMAHHDPRYWDHPDHFDPDRFTAERAKAPAPYSYLPFGGGKRACIGSDHEPDRDGPGAVALPARFRAGICPRRGSADKPDGDPVAEGRVAAPDQAAGADHLRSVAAAGRLITPVRELAGRRPSPLEDGPGRRVT